MEKDNDTQFFDQFRAHGNNAHEHKLQLLYSAIQKDTLSSEQIELIDELLIYPEKNYFMKKNKQKKNQPLPISTRLSSSEILTAAQQIAALLDNKVGFAISTPHGTMYAGNFQPDAKNDIIYLRRPYSDNPNDIE